MQNIINKKKNSPSFRKVFIFLKKKVFLLGSGSVYFGFLHHRPRSFLAKCVFYLKPGMPQQTRQGPHPAELPCEWRGMVNKRQPLTMILGGNKYCKGNETGWCGGGGEQGSQEGAFEPASGCISDGKPLEDEYLILWKPILLSVGASVNRCDGLAEHLET